MIARDRRAAAALLAVALGLVLAFALARPASAPAAAPAIRAPAAILVEPATGDVVYQRQARRSRPVASTTKLMTALVTLEHAKLGQVVTTVPYRASPAESIIGLRGGERMTVADLLRGLLLASANDAAATLAARVGGSQSAFVALMNRRARQLGLTHTHYANAIGLDDPSNHSSAEDLVKLTLILRRNAFFRAVTNLPRATLRTGAHPRVILNRNLLVRAVPEVNGVKTGHTSSAGYILVASATKAGVTVISVVLDEPSEAARDCRFAGPHPLRPEPLSPGDAGAQGAGVRHRQARPSRPARAAGGGRHRRAHRPARRAPADPRGRTSRASSTARCPRARGWGRSRSAGAGGPSRASRWSPAPRSRRPRSGSAAEGC